MPNDVKKMLRKMALFAVPLLLYALVIAAVDPYEMLGVSRIVPTETRRSVALPLHYPLWKLLHYRRDPSPNILLGDSRMMGISPDEVAAATGEQWANLGYGGASLEEILRSFWFAADLVDLRRVVIGVNFNLYSATNAKDRIGEVEAILDNPLLYFSDINVLDATGKLLQRQLLGRRVSVGKPPMSPDEFWRHQIESTTRIFYDNYRYPEDYRRRLREIAEYCRGRGIELKLVIFPSHADLQAQVARYGLEDQYRRFKRDMAELAPVYDFDYVNGLTSDRENFSDPYHLKRSAKRIVIDAVWGGEPEWVRLLGSGEESAAAAGEEGS